MKKILALLGVVILIAGCFWNNIHREIAEEAREVIATAKTDLNALEAKLDDLEDDAETDIHTGFRNVKNALERVETALEDETEEGINAAKEELADLKTEVRELKNKADDLEDDAADDIRKAIRGFEDRIKELERALTK